MSLTPPENSPSAITAPPPPDAPLPEITPETGGAEEFLPHGQSSGQVTRVPVASALTKPPPPPFSKPLIADKNSDSLPPYR